MSLKRSRIKPINISKNVFLKEEWSELISTVSRGINSSATIAERAADQALAYMWLNTTYPELWYSAPWLIHITCSVIQNDCPDLVEVFRQNRLGKNFESIAAGSQSDERFDHERTADALKEHCYKIDSSLWGLDRRSKV